VSAMLINNYQLKSSIFCISGRAWASGRKGQIPVSRPEGETGMSEVPARAGASLPVSVERFSGTRLRVMVGNGVRSVRGISFLRFEKNSN
jgi:hypothetical protein